MMIFVFCFMAPLPHGDHQCHHL